MPSFDRERLVRAVHTVNGMMGAKARVRRFGRGARPRGFTLVEMMVVVAIVGVMATIGIVMLREYIFTAKSVEAAGMVQSIRSAQERWKAFHGSYLDVSDSITDWYPMAESEQGRAKYNFYRNQTTDRDERWKLLDPVVPGPVQFGYAVVAGLPGTAVGDIPALATSEQPTWPTPVDPWYVVQARADKDEDGTPAYFATSSFGPDVYTENPDE